VLRSSTPDVVGPSTLEKSPATVERGDSPEHKSDIAPSSFFAGQLEGSTSFVTTARLAMTAPGPE
jgi:hypothetical protein